MGTAMILGGVNAEVKRLLNNYLLLQRAALAVLCNIRPRNSFLKDYSSVFSL
jgi:hypothetical protein